METATPSNGAVTLNQSRDNCFVIPLAAALTGITISNGDQKKGQTLELHLVQDATGGRAVGGWPASVKLAGGAFTPTATGNRRDVLRFRQVANASDPGGVKYVEVSRSLNIPG